MAETADNQIRSTHTCGKCEWWVETEHLNHAGECHRFPPVPKGTQKDIVAMWPCTTITEFCGEWKESTAPKKSSYTAVPIKVTNAQADNLDLFLTNHHGSDKDSVVIHTPRIELSQEVTVDTN